MPSILRYKKRYERFFHEGAVTSMAFDPHGTILAAGSLDGSVSVWDVNSGATLHCINAHTPVLSLVWSSGPKGFVFGCENGILVSVLLEKAYLRSTYFHAHSRPIHCISPSPNDARLISGAFDEVVVWERGFVSATHEESWRVFKTIPQPPVSYSQSGGAVKVTSVNWLHRRGSNEGKHNFVVSSYLWHGVLCWDLASLSIVWRLANPDCSSLALSPDGSLAVAYSSSHAFEVHDIASRRLIQALPSDTQFDLVSRPVAFAHDGFAIVTGGQGKAFVWDIEHGDELQVLNHGGSCRISTLTTYFSHAADMFIIATGIDEGKSSRIVLWDTTTLPFPGNKNVPPQRDTTAERPSGNWPVWIVFGTAALLFSWRWMGYS